MKIEGKFLNSKLGRRLFTIFCVCALLPLVSSAAVTFIHVKKQLHEQSTENLQLLSKALGMAVYERMIILSGELKRIEAIPGSFPEKNFTGLEDLDVMFVNLFFKDRNGSIKSLLKTKKIKSLPDKLIQTLEPSEKISVLTSSDKTNFSRLFIVLTLFNDKAPHGYIIGEINSAFLWKIDSETILPPRSQLIVMDEEKTIIVSSVKNPENCIKNMPSNSQKNLSRQFEWDGTENKYIARYWDIFMQSRFNSGSWTIILSRDKSYLFSSVNFFQEIFLLSILLSFLIVTFFSMVNIRLILDPLEKLKSGISQILQNNLKTRINVESRDEFEEVAKAFNNMTAQLERQFKTILTNSEIDRAILSSLEPEIIIIKMLSGLDELLSCSNANICIAEHDSRKKARLYFLSDKEEAGLSSQTVSFDENKIYSNLKNKRFISTENKKGSHFNFKPLNSLSGKLIIIPVFINNKIEATINLEYTEDNDEITKDIENAVQLADQMAVALANSNLVRELDQMNEGTLRALARTVDTNSPWTAGHSERVSEMCQKLGKILNLDRHRVDNLTRAALLHDIGKVGISTSILDKKGKLTDEEYNIVKKHPVTGARILEPLKVYKEIIPIVSQHHEQYDGKGYPEGLKGDEIVLEARIMAVADVYDALISDRPYRQGWEREKVIEFIKEKSGSHFDPEIVKAFQNLIENG
jgi:putative nucleotidyltransferase with HDIG domain